MVLVRILEILGWMFEVKIGEVKYMFCVFIVIVGCYCLNIVLKYVKGIGCRRSLYIKCKVLNVVVFIIIGLLLNFLFLLFWL